MCKNSQEEIKRNGYFLVSDKGQISNTLEEINPTLQEMNTIRFWLILTPNMVYFEKQISTREVPMGKTRYSR